MLNKIKKISLFIFIAIILVFSNIRINISESAPIGIYLINRFSDKYNKGDYIIYRINDEYKEYVTEKLKELDTIKQIKALEGDRVEYKKNKIYINEILVGELLYNIPINSREKYIVKNAEYLTIGDGDYSLDGRYYGTIKKKDIKYKAYLIYRFKI